MGNYVKTVTVTGFKTYTHSNLALSAMQRLREDVPLQVGASTEFVEIVAEASLLHTESAELSHHVSIDAIDALPLIGIGTVNSGTSGYRNPYNTLLTLPGVSSYGSSSTFVMNGLGAPFALKETMRVEGQDSTSRNYGTYDYTQMAQPAIPSCDIILHRVQPSRLPSRRPSGGLDGTSPRCGAQFLR